MDPPVQESFEVPGREELLRGQLGISVIIGIVQDKSLSSCMWG